MYEKQEVPPGFVYTEPFVYAHFELSNILWQLYIICEKVLYLSKDVFSFAPAKPIAIS